MHIVGIKIAFKKKKKKISYLSQNKSYSFCFSLQIGIKYIILHNIQVQGLKLTSIRLRNYLHA